MTVPLNLNTWVFNATEEECSLGNVTYIEQEPNPLLGLEAGVSVDLPFASKYYLSIFAFNNRKNKMRFVENNIIF